MLLGTSWIWLICQMCLSLSIPDLKFFGQEMEYLCHCVDNQQCSSTGQCDACESGWFGPSCQYENLLSNCASCKVNGNESKTELIDNNNATCMDPIKKLVILLDKSYSFTWIRLVYQDNIDLNIDATELIFNNSSDSQTTMPCLHKKLYKVNNQTIDITCNISKTINQLYIEWNADKTICEFYFSGGRNIALKQQANQSSTYMETKSYSADNAINGDTIHTDPTQGYCSHTSNDIGGPSWSVTFKKIKAVNRYVIYNRDDSYKERLNGFSLLSYSTENSGDTPAFSYNETEDDQTIYTINSTTKTIIKVTIRLEKPEFLTLCQVQVFGDSICSDNSYGRDCEWACKCHDEREQCLVATGGCSSGCAAGYTGEDCQTDCEDSYWGVDCLGECNAICLEQSCNKVNGLCDRGCLGYSNYPYCNITCDKTHHGVNCSEPCPSHCDEQGCDHLTGLCYSCDAGYRDTTYCNTTCQDGLWGKNCLSNCSIHCFNETKKCDGQTSACSQGCLEGYMIPNCFDECTDGSYGVNCSQTCSLNCSGGLCNRISGLCLGCEPGHQGEICNETCISGYFGLACKEQCNANCLSGLCDAVDGKCIDGCLTGHRGPWCKQKMGSDDDSNINLAAIIAPVIAVVVLAVIVVAGVILWRRRNQVKKLESVTNDNTFPTALSSSKIYKENYNAPFEDSRIDEQRSKPNPGEYYNCAPHLTQQTSIAIEDLNSFMRSHDKKFFSEQFHKVPEPQNVTMEVGLSEVNKSKNRYKNICTYDHSRVHLVVNTTKQEGDFINASYIEGYKKKEKFIASQGPNLAILNDFVRMMWEQKVEKVVMLTNLIEEGKSKCERYWPEKDKANFGDIKVKLLNTDVFADYTIRHLELRKKDQLSRQVTHFHFINWPDKGVPTSPWGIVDFQQRVYSTTTTKPILVHCSAGVGRTGTFIALCNVIRQAEDTGRMDFFNTLSKIREDRIFMIQTPEQYEFLHKAAQVAMVCLKTTVTVDNIARMRSLETHATFDMKAVEREFNAICTIVNDFNQRYVSNIEDGDEDGNVYQNSGTASQRLKNRFPSIAPNRNNRVNLMYESKEMGNYINAVFLPSFTKPCGQILTQLPMPTSVADFWRMITQNKVSLIVAFDMNSVNEDKSIGQYLPISSSEPLVSHRFHIHTLPAKRGATWEEELVTVKTVSQQTVNSSKQSNTEDLHLTHIRFTAANSNSSNLSSFLRQVRSYNAQVDGTILFMCRNGAEHSGLACVLTLLLDRFDNDFRLTVPLVVGMVKSVRPQVIPTLEQYRTLYDVLIMYNESSTIYSTYNNVGITNQTKLEPTGVKVKKSDNTYENANL